MGVGEDVYRQAAKVSKNFSQVMVLPPTFTDNSRNFRRNLQKMECDTPTPYFSTHQALTYPLCKMEICLHSRVTNNRGIANFWEINNWEVGRNREWKGGWDLDRYIHVYTG